MAALDFVRGLFNVLFIDEFDCWSHPAVSRNSPALPAPLVPGRPANEPLMGPPFNP
jgi:hypothetical protein